MGQEIVYCAQCRRRIAGVEFDRGEAFQIGNRLVCSTCAAAVMPSLDLKERDRLLQQMFRATRDRRSTSSASLPSVRAPLAADTPRRMSTRKTTTRSIPLAKPPPAPAAAPRPSALPTFLLAAFIGASAVIFLLFLSSGKRAPPADDTLATRPVRMPPAPPVAGPAPSAADPREVAARDAIHRAELFQERNPQDADGGVRQWEQAEKAAARTSLLGEARAKLDLAKRRRTELYDRELAALDEQARGLIARGEYKAAWDVYRGAQTRHEHPDWEFSIEKRTREAYQAAAKQMSTLKAQAAEAVRRKDSATVREVHDRVAGWGFPELGAELDRAIAAAASEPSPASPEDAGPPWISLLKGRWIDELVKANCGWKLEDGALVGSGEQIRPARTWDDYASGEIRIRFEISGSTYVFFNVRQGGDGSCMVALERRHLESIAPGEHVIVITFRQGPVTATLDGKPHPVQIVRTPVTGALQFCPAKGRLKVLSIEYRP
jgi:hypothetical protein